MKLTIPTVLLVLNYLHSLGQDSIPGTIFQTSNKTQLYYVTLHTSGAYVYQMGYYFDKAGSGYSIKNTDTLTGQTNLLYEGKIVKLISENNKFYLLTGFTKGKKFLLQLVTNASNVVHNLNNAYYLDSYFKMSDSLNRTYPLHHHSFRNGYYSWEGLPNKEINHFEFRKFTTERLKELQDSIGYVEEKNTSLTNYIVENLKTLDYNTLKDSLVKLPAEYGHSYYATAINEIAKTKPGYFFKLSEDCPQNKGIIFTSVEDKQVIEGLKAVEGHEQVKKEFFKDKRFGKTMPYKIIGIYAVIGGLLTWLIVSQN